MENATQTDTPGAPLSPETGTAPAPLRVALISCNYNYIFDGAAMSQNRLVAHLLEREHEVMIFAATGKAPAFEHAGTVTPVPSVRLPGKRGEYRIGLGLTAQSRARLDAFGPDLIHIATPDYTGLTALSYADRRRIPVVSSFHTRFDTYPRYYGAAWLEKYVTRYMRWFYRRCVHVYPPVPPMLDELAREGIGRELRLWRRGVDHALFNPERRDMAWRRGLGFVDDDVVVAFVGRLVLEKGIDIFADAVRLTAQEAPKLRALIVGDGPESARFEARLPEGVFIGHQSGADLARAYASADIFFNPSISETAGNVTLEAMACALPCLAAGPIGFVRDGETGLLAGQGATAADYASKLVQLAGDPASRAAMGAAGHAKALSEHHWPTILDEVIDHYRDAIRGYHGDRGS